MLVFVVKKLRSSASLGVREPRCRLSAQHWHLAHVFILASSGCAHWAPGYLVFAECVEVGVWCLHSLEQLCRHLAGCDCWAPSIQLVVQDLSASACSPRQVSSCRLKNSKKCTCKLAGNYPVAAWQACLMLKSCCLWKVWSYLENVQNFWGLQPRPPNNSSNWHSWCAGTPATT